MKRRAFLASLTAVGLVLAIPAQAQTAQDQIVRQLKIQGYRSIRISRTWLGRVRIVARGPEGVREIILNPSSGVIMRDYTDRKDNDDDRFTSSGSDDDGDNSGSDDKDDDDKEDDSSDDEKDDNSGPGGGDDDDDDD